MTTAASPTASQQLGAALLASILTLAAEHSDDFEYDADAATSSVVDSYGKTWRVGEKAHYPKGTTATVFLIEEGEALDDEASTPVTRVYCIPGGDGSEPAFCVTLQGRYIGRKVFPDVGSFQEAVLAEWIEEEEEETEPEIVYLPAPASLSAIDEARNEMHALAKDVAMLESVGGEAQYLAKEAFTRAVKAYVELMRPAQVAAVAEQMKAFEEAEKAKAKPEAETKRELPSTASEDAPS